MMDEVKEKKWKSAAIRRLIYLMKEKKICSGYNELFQASFIVVFNISLYVFGVAIVKILHWNNSAYIHGKTDELILDTAEKKNGEDTYANENCDTLAGEVWNVAYFPPARLCTGDWTSSSSPSGKLGYLINVALEINMETDVISQMRLRQWKERDWKSVSMTTYAVMELADFSG